MISSHFLSHKNWVNSIRFYKLLYNKIEQGPSSNEKNKEMNIRLFIKSFVYVSICVLTLSASSVMAENDEEAIEVQKNLAIQHIQQGNYEQADAIIAALAANYPGSNEAGNSIWRIAAHYLRSGEYAKAKQLCEMSLTTWPTHSEYKDTVSKLAEVYIREAGLDNTVAVTKTLIEKYPNNKNMIRDYLRREAAHFSRYGHISQAQKMSQAFLESSPETESDIWAQAGVVSSYLILRDTSKAEAAVARLLSGFSGDKDFAEVVNWLAGEYFKASDSAKAIQLYQLVLSLPPSALSKHPTSHFQLRAHKGLALIYVSLGDIAKVDEELYKIEHDHQEEFGFDEAVFEIAEAYFLRARDALQEDDQEQANTDFSKAIAIWQRNIDQFSDPRRLCKAYYYLGMSYQSIEDYMKAAQAYANAYQQDPKFECADYCLYGQGYCFEMLMAEGEIPPADAKTIIAIHYQELISKFLNSNYAKSAQRWLDDNL